MGAPAGLGRRLGEEAAVPAAVSPLRRASSVRVGIAGRWRLLWPWWVARGRGDRLGRFSSAARLPGRAATALGGWKGGSSGNPDLVPGGGAAATLPGWRRLRCVRVPAGLRRRGEPAGGKREEETGARARLRARARPLPALPPPPSSLGPPQGGRSTRRRRRKKKKFGGVLGWGKEAGGRALAARGSWEQSRVGRGGCMRRSRAAGAGVGRRGVHSYTHR